MILSLLLPLLILAEDKVQVFKDFAQITAYPTFHFKKGVRTYNWRDIPSSILPHTIRFSTGEPTVELLSQSVIAGAKKQEDFVVLYEDKIVDVQLKNGSQFKGKLLKVFEDSYLFQPIDETRFFQFDKDQVSSLIFPQLSNISFEPSLNLQVFSQNDKQTKSKISYLCRDLSWDSKYNLIFHDDYLVINNWVVIQNNTDKSFNEVALSAIEGVQLNEYVRPMNRQAKMASFNEDGMSVDVKNLEDAYEFNLPHKATIQPYEQFQYQLLYQESINFTKQYVYNTRNTVVDQIYVIENSSENYLGQPLPSGTAYLYQKDGLEETFIGSAKLKYTPSGSSIKLKVRNALDLNAKTTRTLVNQTESHMIFEYTVRLENFKNDSVLFHIEQELYDKDVIEESLQKYTVKDDKVKFKITILAGGSYILKYRIKRFK
jgi:hypothetical protein